MVIQILLCYVTTVSQCIIIIIYVKICFDNLHMYFSSSTVQPWWLHKYTAQPFYYFLHLVPHLYFCGAEGPLHKDRSLRPLYPWCILLTPTDSPTGSKWSSGLSPSLQWVRVLGCWSQHPSVYCRGYMKYFTASVLLTTFTETYFPCNHPSFPWTQFWSILHLHNPMQDGCSAHCSNNRKPRMS